MHRGCSSAGRAPALHAGGHRFEPDHLHQILGGSKLMAYANNLNYIKRNPEGIPRYLENCIGRRRIREDVYVSKM